MYLFPWIKLFLCWIVCCVSASTHSDFYGRRYDHYHGKYSDSELMVDVLNNFGLRMLMAHNENNDNNIAFSPYGIGVILIALGEGLRGEALHELRKALYLPYEAHTIRVGLRDIHRHLKSYFIPKEGFLAGITLNIENVSINPDYISLLKFYGYDIDSFNTALYPENHVTTTESGAMGGKEETTATPGVVTASSLKTTTEEIPTPNSVETDAPTTEFTTTTDRTTTKENQDTIPTINSIDETLQTVVTTEESIFRSTSPSTETTTIIQSTVPQTSNDFVETTTQYIETLSVSTLSAPTTDDAADPTSSITSADATDITTAKNEGETSSMKDPQSSTTEVTPIESSTNEPAEVSSILSSAEETTPHFTSATETTPSTVDQLETSTIEMNIDETQSTTPTVRNIRSSEESLNSTDDEDLIEGNGPRANTDGAASNLVDHEKNEGDERKNDEFGSEDWKIQINNQITLLNPIEDTTFASNPGNRVQTTINKETRIARSIEEYVITRFYHFNTFRPTKSYIPDEPLYFYVNENTREAGLDYETYDTVLPFLYLPNPSAMALAFPLDSEKYYLLLMLPSETYRLDDLICKLYMHNTFKYVLNNLELTHVKANIPSFSLRGRITLTNTLQKLGIRRIFEPRQSDFSPMTMTEDVYVTNIEQAISVTIKNNLNIKKDKRHGHHLYSEPIRFDVNRPFLYFVIDSELQIILMAGKVVNPLNIRIK